jgi:MFS superfamily sulfate permease-like transporter
MAVSIHPDRDDDVLGPLDSGASSVRIPAQRSAAARPRMAARSWREAEPATGQIVCLRLTGQLCADTAQPLLDAVCARVRAAVPPPCAVVLDLSDTLAADDGARAALESLRALLADGHTRLRLVLPEGEARAALCSNGAVGAIGIDALHTSVRAAILAAHAALPGPALVTPALRAMLSRPPELLLPSRDDGEPRPFGPHSG